MTTRMRVLLTAVLLGIGLCVATSVQASAPYSCTTTSTNGRCGPYNYAGVQGAASNPYVDQNEWGPISGEKQTLNANNPGDWMITSSTPVNPGGGVTTFPNTGAPFNEQPLSALPELIGSFSETMPHTSGTSAWATYDNWFDNWNYEVMIQNDFVGNGPCDFVGVATFGGSNGVPSQLWGLCTYGSELIWKLAAPGSTVGTNKTVNESSGSVDIKAMINWLVSHGYMTANPTVTNISYGWEISSTAGVSQNFVVNSYSLITSGSAPVPPSSSSAPPSSSSAPPSSSSAPPSSSSAPPSTTSSAPAPTGSLLVGDRSKEANLDGNVTGDAEAFSYVAAASGKSAKVSFYVDSANRATGAWIGIYTDSGWNSPSKLLKQAWFRPTAGWDTVTLSGVPIASGHKYWLAVLGTGGRIAFRDQGYGSKSEENSRSGLTSLPAGWSDGTAWSSGKASFYVTA